MAGLDKDIALIRALVDYAGVSAAEVAAKAKISPRTIQRMKNGNPPARLSAPTMESLRAAYPNFPDWDRYLNDSAEFGDHSPQIEPAQRDADLVALNEFDISFGMGATYIADHTPSARSRVFSRAWVRQFTSSPFSQLFWATGNGTSMMPAILDNDILLIDTAQKTPRMWDQIWAIEMHGLGMIKALRPGKDKAMRIISLNPDWPEELAFDNEMQVVGRVVAIVRKL